MTQVDLNDSDDSNDRGRRPRTPIKVIVLTPPKDEDLDRGKWFYDLAIASDEAAKMDDRQLLWALMKTSIWRQPLGSVEDIVLQELADRLYPEFDGEDVIWAEWGWITPDGEIRYVNN